MTNIYIELLIYLGISVGFNLLLFIPAFIFKTDKLTDISYSISFVFLVIAAFFRKGDVNIWDLVALIMVLAWAIRLGGYLFIRIRKISKDKRFDGIREKFWKFFGFWFIQGVSVWVVMIPTLLFIFSERSESSLALLVIGAWLFLEGLTLETISDYQKYKFINEAKRENRQRHWVNVGFWNYMRHPNYLGEITVWIGIYIFSLSRMGLVSGLISLIGPVYIFTIVRFFSGIPILERKDRERWGNDPEYLTYVEKTGLLLPKFTRSKSNV